MRSISIFEQKLTANEGELQAYLAAKNLEATQRSRIFFRFRQEYPRYFSSTGVGSGDPFDDGDSSTIVLLESSIDGTSRNEASENRTFSDC
jgi:hypothetical protein